MPKISLKLAIALCLLISLTTFSMAMPTVNADSRGVVFYGSRWSVTQDEQEAARAVINHMKYNFYYRGYACNDFYGSQTQKQTVLYYASAMEETFDYVAMFHHGHGGLHLNYPNYHRDFFDDDGPDYLDDQIWDYEVWPKTRSNKHFFVMLWTCRQGDHEGGRYGPLGAYGMPFSWLDPISRGDCFIGFKDASMPLTQKSKHNLDRPYRDFVCYFDYYALYQGRSVIEALNYASQALFGRTFYNTELWTGFWAIWRDLQLARNGGFERGDESHWIVGGPGDHKVTSEDRYSGLYSMRLGYKSKPNALNARDYAYQLITIPRNSTDVKLSFRYHLVTYDRLEPGLERYDWFEVYVAPEGGSPSLVFKKGGSWRGVLQDYGWAQVTTDLSHYADPYYDRSIYIYFAVANWVDTDHKTWCYIDDISVTFTKEDKGWMKIYGNPNIYLHIPPSNSPPNTPPTPSGPSSGYTGIYYTYSTSTIDPDGDSVRYQFDWGDGSTTTTDWYPSGTQVSASHSWSSPGTYNVKVRAQDSLNAWSGWSYPRIVNIAPSYLLTVLAYDLYGYFVYADVYIDGQWLGYTGSTFSVAPGTHELYVSDWAYNEWGAPCYFYYYDIGASNPIIISVSSDMTITAWYYPYY